VGDGEASDEQRDLRALGGGELRVRHRLEPLLLLLVETEARALFGFEFGELIFDVEIGRKRQALLRRRVGRRRLDVLVVEGRLGHGCSPWLDGVIRSFQCWIGHAAV
jgi:hypothetical protein